MGIPYYPYTPCKNGSIEVGISLSEFMVLVDNGDIEVSYRGGKTLLVNNDTLNSYIAKHGGRKEKYREYLRLQVHLLQEREITKMHELIKMSGYKKYALTYNNIVKTKLMKRISYHKFNAQDIVEFFDILKMKKDNNKDLNKLYALGFTDSVLEKYYEDEFFDINIHKNSIKPIFINERIGNATYKINSFMDFFKKYKSTLRKYKMIKFLRLSQIRPIVLKVRKRFGLK